jgi:hypothetical protein
LISLLSAETAVQHWLASQFLGFRTPDHRNGAEVLFNRSDLMKTSTWVAMTVIAAAAFASQASAQALLPVLTFEGPDVSGAADGGVAAAATAAEAGQDVRLNFDVTFDAAGVTNEGFLQVGVFVNSEAGFQALWFGGLLEGNIGFTGAFPTLDPAAIAGGVTMTTLDPVSYPAGDNLGAVRVSIPVGPGTIMPIGSGGDPGFDFAQMGFNMNSGYGGVVDFSFDNVGFEIIPEPTTGAMMVMTGMAMAALGRRRK